MSQVDNRNSSATKRARTDGGRREDDWTCPSCNNVNFSFRTTCNMRNCTQPRPANHNFKPAAKLLHAPPSYQSSNAYGPGAPSSMYVGAARPYGNSMFNGTSMPAYDVPFAGGSAYQFNHGNRHSGGSPYRHLHMTSPAPYPGGGSMIGNAGMYGVPSIDRYGFGLPLTPTQMGPRPGFFPDTSPQKRGGGHDNNDWTCPKCSNVNFSFRAVCNMRKCNTPKPGSQVIAKTGKVPKPDSTPDGSWKCEKCNNINYPFRTKCNRQNCGADKPSETNKSPSDQSAENNQ